MLQPRPWFLFCFLVYTVAIRLVPYVLALFGMSIDPETTLYPWNFSPLYALCLFGAARFPQTRWGYAVPLGAMLLGDLGIWALTGRLDWAFYPYQVFVYAGMALMITSGLLLRSRRSIAAIAGVGLGSSVLFFLLTNFGVWLLSDRAPYSIPYTRDLAGLIDCYVMALPFFRNTLISMAVFSALLFSPLAVTVRKPVFQPLIATE